MTEAAEKTARAEERIAVAKEKLVEHVDEFLRICDGDDDDVPANSGKKIPPSKPQQQQGGASDGRKR